MMKLYTMTSTALAAIGASLLLVATTVNAAKPGGGGTSDPCAASNLDFPAFTYWQQSGEGQQLFVADASGKCSRPVVKPTPGMGSVGAGAFSYPVVGKTNVGRVVWPEGNAIYGMDFTVTGTSIALGARNLLYSGSLYSLDLSKDGNTLYIGVTGPIVKALTIDTNFLSDVYVGVAGTAFNFVLAISADGSALFVDQFTQASGVVQLIRIDLPCVGSCTTVLATSTPGSIASAFYPAPSPVAVDGLGPPILVFSDYQPGSNNCWQLRYLDVSASNANAVSVFGGTQPRYGRGSSWYGDQLLTNGRKPPDSRGKCADTGMITQIDPATSAETALVRGYDPDGR